MQLRNKKESIRHSILVTILGFVFIFMLLAILYIANTFSVESKQQTQQNVIQWARYVANLSIDNLNSKDYKGLARKLDLLAANSNIRFVDIYQFQPISQTYGAVVLYDHIKGSQSNPTSITNRIYPQDRANYATPQIRDNKVQYVATINDNGKELGYLYIQTNNQVGVSFDDHLFIIIAVLFVVLITAVFIVSFKLENKISAPLKDIGADLLHISQTKDFSFRMKEMPYQEVDTLSRNINNFLNRTERHVNKLGLAEQQSLKLNIELEDKVAKRTHALKESNQELLSTLEKLHQFQDQLVESEKMASLGDMVAGAAHEVNTPIGLGVTASTLLSDRLKDIKLCFEDKSLKSSQLKKFLDEGEENVGIIYRNLKRAAELISSFKKVAVDQSSDEFRRFNFSELLNEILLTLAPQINKTEYKIDFDCPDDLLVVSKPGAINQILINLILNSITHGFDKKQHGTINVVVAKLGEQLTINFQDDGKGMDPAIKDKVFDPFTTTKRGEGGSGLGLHLVYNLVTQALGGSIRLESELDKGAKFEISFPVSDQLL